MLALELIERFTQTEATDEQAFVQGKETQEGIPFSTFGPGKNEIYTTYGYGSGAHQIRFLAKPSPDALLVHQAKMVGFYRKTDADMKVVPIERGIKDEILKSNG